MKLKCFFVFLLSLVVGLVVYWQGVIPGGDASTRSYVFEMQAKAGGQAQRTRMDLSLQDERAVLDSFLLPVEPQAPVQTQKIIAGTKEVTSCNYLTHDCETNGFKPRPQGDRQLMHEFEFEVIDAKASFAGVPCKKVHYRMDMDIDHTVLKQTQNVEVEACFADLDSDLLAAFPQLSVGSGFDNLQGLAADSFAGFQKVIAGLTPVYMQVSGTSGLSSALSEELNTDPLPMNSTLKLVSFSSQRVAENTYTVPKSFKLSQVGQKNGRKDM